MIGVVPTHRPTPVAHCGLDQCQEILPICRRQEILPICRRLRLCEKLSHLWACTAVTARCEQKVCCLGCRKSCPVLPFRSPSPLPPPTLPSYQTSSNETCKQCRSCLQKQDIPSSAPSSVSPAPGSMAGWPLLGGPGMRHSTRS